MKSLRCYDCGGEGERPGLTLPKPHQGEYGLAEFVAGTYPACSKHGAMNRVAVGAPLWRCLNCNVGCEYGGLVGSPAKRTTDLTPAEAEQLLNGSERQPTEESERIQRSAREKLRRIAAVWYAGRAA